MSDRASHDQQTRKAILDAAAELFVSDGLAATSFDAIARRAGVMESTLVARFRDTEALLSALAERHVAESLGAMAGVAIRLRTDEPDLETTVRVFVEAAVSDQVSVPQLYAILAASSPGLRGALADAEGPIADEIAWHLRRLGVGGEDPGLRALLIVHMVFGTTQRMLLTLGADATNRSVVAELTRMTVAAARA